jgi:hypothetical protein
MNVSESCLDRPHRPGFWTALLAQVFASVAYFYCRRFHNGISRPVNGKYRCWRCLREFEIEW